MALAAGSSNTATSPDPPPTGPESVFRLLALPLETQYTIFGILFRPLSLRPRDYLAVEGRNAGVQPVNNQNPPHCTAILQVNKDLNKHAKAVFWKHITLRISDLRAKGNDRYWEDNWMADSSAEIRSCSAAKSYLQGRHQLRHLEQTVQLPFMWQGLLSPYVLPNLRTITVSSVKLVYRGHLPQHPGQHQASSNLLEEWCSLIDKLRAVGSGQYLKKPEVVAVEDPSYSVRVHMFACADFRAMLLLACFHGLGFGCVFPNPGAPGGRRFDIWLSGDQAGQPLPPVFLKAFQEKPVNGRWEGWEGTRWLKAYRKATHFEPSQDKPDNRIRVKMFVTVCQLYHLTGTARTVFNFEWDLVEEWYANEAPYLAITSNNYSWLKDPAKIERFWNGVGGVAKY